MRANWRPTAKATRYLTLLLAWLSVALGCKEPTAQEVLADVRATYRDLETYRSEGTVVFKGSINGEEGTQETSFRMLLKKPNLYLITWSERVGPEVDEGAIWNDGRQAYYYREVRNANENRKAYHKASDDRSAIASATGVSRGVAASIPGLFFPGFYPDYQRGFGVGYTKNARIDRVEQVQGEECYVITGQSATSKEVTYWVSKSRNFIVKNYDTYNSPKGAMPIPEIDEEMIETMMGPDASGERVLKVKKIIDDAEELMKSTTITGSSTVTHEKCSTPKLVKADFQFNPPKDAVLKKSVWHDIPPEDPEENPEGE